MKIWQHTHLENQHSTWNKGKHPDGIFNAHSESFVIMDMKLQLHVAEHEEYEHLPRVELSTFQPINNIQELFVNCCMYSPSCAYNISHWEKKTGTIFYERQTHCPHYNQQTAPSVPLS